MRRIYLICDSRDIDEVQPVRDFLFDEFEVRLPVFDGDEAEVRREHEANLGGLRRRADLLRRRQRAVAQEQAERAEEDRRIRPRQADARDGVYIAPPDTADKQRFRTHEAIVINPGGPFTPSALEPFVSVLRQA